MTEFVPSFSTQQLLPPWNSVGCVRWGFIISIPEKCVRDYLDNYMNLGDGDRTTFVYKPVDFEKPGGPQYGMIIFAWHPDISSIRKNTPPNRLSYSEVFWMIPAERFANKSSKTPEKTVWLQPFSFCNNATVIFGSREIWGSDKVYATVEGPESSLKEMPEGWQVRVSVDGIKKFSPRACSKPIGCMQINKGAASQEDLGELLKGKSGLEKFAKVLLGKGGVSEQEWEEVLKNPSKQPGQIEFNNLKQFRAAEVSNMGKAIYRAIVASQAQHQNVNDLSFYDAKCASAEFLWSDSVGELATTLFGVPQPKGWSSEPVDEKPAKGSETDWKLPLVSLPVELAFSFTSTVQFKELKTIQTYYG